MQRRTPDKPYRRALANYPRHKEEIEQLPRKYDAVLARYPYKRGKYLLEEEDFFQELVLHCEEAELSSGGTFLERACRKIDAELYEQVQKAYPYAVQAKFTAGSSFGPAVNFAWTA